MRCVSTPAAPRVLLDRANELGEAYEELRELSAGHCSGLTHAELRLVPLLASHLSFREIGDHFSITRNTVKSPALSVYRKLGASYREGGLARPDRERGDSLGKRSSAGSRGLLRPRSQVARPCLRTRPPTRSRLGQSPVRASIAPESTACFSVS
jgi:DNA-binding CsgD family transcriptional regulator